MREPSKKGGQQFSTTSTNTGEVNGQEAPSIHVHGSEVTVRRLRLKDPYVVAYLSSIDEAKRVDAVKLMVEIGARALTMDTGVVTLRDLQDARQAAIDGLKSEGHNIRMVLGALGESLASSLEAVYRSQFGSDGTDGRVQQIFASMSRAFLQELQSKLNSLSASFDEHRDDGVPAGIRRCVVEAWRETLEAFRQSLASAGADNPLLPSIEEQRQWRARFEERFAAFEQAVTRVLTEIAQQVAASTARHDERAKGTAKGLEYQEAVHSRLWLEADHHGDLVEDVAGVKGHTGKTGDSLVILNQDEMTGREIKVIWEAKSQKGKSASAVLSELDTAMTNHGALAGVMVFEKRDLLPKGFGPVQLFSGNRMVCVFNPDETDALELQIAYRVARGLAKVASSGARAKIDETMLAESIDKMQGLLQKLRGPKTDLNEIKKKADSAYVGIEAYEREILSVLREVETLCEA